MEKERILLPQSFGDNVRWYNYQVIRTDVDGDPNNLSTVIATGTVGWDCLPNVSRFGAQNQAGDAARGSAGVYLLELLSLTNDDVLTVDEQARGCSITVKFRRLPGRE